MVFKNHSSTTEANQPILKDEPNSAEDWRQLGKVYFQQGNHLQALGALDQALTLNPDNDNLYCDLGLVWQQLGDVSQGIQAYKTAIALNGQNSLAYCQLGNLFLELGQFELAQQAYNQGITVDPENIQGYLGLGNLLTANNQVEQAILLYQQALAWHPEDPDLFYQYGLAIAAHSTPDSGAFYLGSAAYYRQDYQTAIDYYQTLPTFTLDVYLNLADCYQQLDQPQRAIQLYQQALSDSPDEVEVYLGLIRALQNSGEIETAIQLAEQGLVVLPDHLRLKFACQRLLPIVYDNEVEIQFYRQRFQQLLNPLILTSALETPAQQQQALEALGDETHFYLQYQGLNDLELQQQYGHWVCQVMAAHYPEYTQTITRTKTSKLKIGYVSAFFNWHTVGIVFLGWIQQHNPHLFEVYCYHLNSETDKITDFFREESDYFYQFPNSLNRILQQIVKDEIDILIFLDIGMFAPATQLAGLRLAPIQCVAWGHPVTTGLPTIDYFISAEFLEPTDAKNHYSEQLITLPNVGIYYPPLPLPHCSKSHSDFGLKADQVIYLSCQSLFKYLPQYDYLFVAIAQQVKTAKFVFLSHWNAGITEKFRVRLNLAFSQAGLNFEQYCVILPRLDQQNYLQLQLLSDIGLDTIQFTGFLTSLDGIACHLPIVTCQGKWMRSRQTAGLLKRIGVTETIAQNPSEYIKIAVRLGLDSDWRQLIATEIQTHQSILYHDDQAVQALEQFYLSRI